MSTELAHRPTQTGLSISEDQTWWTDRQQAALAQIGVADAPQADQAVFLHQCQRTGLDPFARQIYMIGRWSREGTKYTIQTSIDGFRLIGRRAADARRETLEVADTEWCGADGVWRDVWLSDEPPAAARVAVIRNGGRFPAVALFKEYAGTKKDGSLTQMWETKGALMIAKCAEALAWRKAYPQDLSGLYTSDEMGQADNSRTPVSPASPQRPAEHEPVGMTAEQSAALAALMKAEKLTKADMLTFACDVVGRKIKSAADLSADEAAIVIAGLEATATPPGVDADTGEVVDAEIVPDEQPAFDDAAWLAGAK